MSVAKLNFFSLLPLLLMLPVFSYFFFVIAWFVAGGGVKSKKRKKNEILKLNFTVKYHLKALDLTKNHWLTNEHFLLTKFIILLKLNQTLRFPHFHLKSLQRHNSHCKIALNEREKIHDTRKFHCHVLFRGKWNEVCVNFHHCRERRNFFLRFFFAHTLSS